MTRVIIAAVALALLMGMVAPAVADAGFGRKGSKWGCTVKANQWWYGVTQENEREWQVAPLIICDEPMHLRVKTKIYQRLPDGTRQFINSRTYVVKKAWPWSRATPGRVYMSPTGLDVDGVWCSRSSGPYFFFTKVQRVGKPGSILVKSPERPGKPGCNTRYKSPWFARGR